MATLDDIQQFLTRTGKPVPPTTVERVPLRGPKVEDTIFSPVLSAIHELLTSERSKQYTKDAMLKRMKQDNAYTGPTMKGIGLKEKVSDLLGGRSQNVIGEGPVSAAANLLSGDLDPTTAAGASEAAIIPKLAVAGTDDILKKLSRNFQQFNTTANPNNAENLYYLMKQYKMGHTKQNRNFDFADPEKVKRRAQDIIDSEFFVDFGKTPEDLRPFDPVVQRVYEQIAQERPDLVGFTGGAKLRPSHEMDGNTGLYTHATHATPHEEGLPRIEIDETAKPKLQIETLVHEFEHADADRMGMLPKKNFDIPYELRKQELSARGNEPLPSGELPNDVDLVTRYLTGLNTVAKGQSPLQLLLQKRPERRASFVSDQINNKWHQPLGYTSDIMYRQLPFMNIDIARTGVKRGLALEHGRSPRQKAFRVKSRPTGELSDQFMGDLPAGTDPAKDTFYDLRPLLEAILKLPRY